MNLITLPVKPGYGHANNAVEHMRGQIFGDRVHGWAVKAEIKLIIKSCQFLPNMANKFEWEQVYMPRPGCSAGELNWNDVKKAISFLDDRFIAVTYRNS